MLKTLFLAVALLAGCNTYNVTNLPSLALNDDRADAVELVTEMALPTIMVEAEGGLGSGIMFTDTLALTAAHVVSHRDALRNDDGTVMRNPDGSLIPGPLVVENAAIMKSKDSGLFLSKVTVIKIDDELDLAVLKLETAYPYGKAKFAVSEPYLYQKCWISGHPHGVTDTTITEGRVQALWDGGFIRYSALSTFGNSGGPVWIRVDGKFLVFSICQRVHVEGMSATTHMGLGVLPAKMLEFVREYN